MPTITELVKEFREGEICFNEVLNAVADGEISPEGEKLVGDVNFLWVQDVINDAEREMILSLVS